MLQIETPRLVLRDLQEADWEMVYAMSQAEAVTRYQTWLRLADDAAAQEWVRAAMYHNGLVPRMGYNQAIVCRNDGRAVGWIGWGRPSAPEEARAGVMDFGYALLPEAWGQGYMTEALRAVVDYCFGSLGAQAVRGDCNSANVASARVMQKAGLALQAEGDETDDSGAPMRCQHYEITRRAWERGRLDSA
jgi:ribosomal-protein-alanine N-acetyltransferase